MKNISLFVILFMLLISGCTGSTRPKLVPSGGIITKDGKPLADVRIEFRKPDTGASAFAETDTDGKFTLTYSLGEQGAEPDKYLVTIFQKGKPIPLPAGVKAEDIPEERRNQTTPEVSITNSDKKPIEVEIPATGNLELKIEVK
ncbi:MAG: carboxypeptidase-like regulatory domain-containing protein [Planctomycetaceae bacterium]|nr:carboxypeptidase-like regulatory domain-containing protein [Planctomycetaceae bacterium]